MCGICGTYISSRIVKTNFIDSSQLILDLERALVNFNLISINFITNKINFYKSDINFLNYFYNSKERANINKIIVLLKQIQRKNPIYLNKINDLIFNLEIELKNRYLFVKKNLPLKYYNNEKYVIFLKVFNSLINSINYLEMRGRDSLGLCLQIKFKNENLKLNTNKNFFLHKYNRSVLLTFIFKTFNQIGILGQNTENIVNQFFQNKELIKILNQNYETVSVFFHTRWASVGKINKSNTHPISNILQNINNLPSSHTAVNGDVYNYKSYIEKKQNKLSYLNNDCTTDSLSLSYAIGDLDRKNFKNKNLQKINFLKGSYCSCALSDNFDGNILLIKNGQQGLYLGKSEDRYYFSSDVYGLLEESNSFLKIIDDCFLFLPMDSRDSVNFFDIKTNKKIKNNNTKFAKFEINLRDIYLSKYKHFFEKEIEETPNILQKTNYNFLSFDNDNLFSNKEILKLIKKINNNKINKIIITGMGTCYTAAVSIANYMRHIIVSKSNLDIIVQPHMASEGSGFYKNKNMNDHLVIVLGQSGTTVDTNTYAKIAKDRGAYTISFLNKRQGDLSYLVDLNLYIGDGRDVEISVPSTKTYLAHVALGYIFTLLIVNNKDNFQFIQNEKSKLLQIPSNLSKFISNLKKYNFEELFKIFCINPKWFIIYDDSNLSVTNSEIKIKLSELCYHTIPTFNLNNFINLNIRDSIIIFNTSDKFINLQGKINNLLSKNNYIVLVSNDLSFNLIEDKKFNFYYLNNSVPFFELFKSIIFFQFFSYKLALFMNKRFINLTRLINSKNKTILKNRYKNILYDIDKGIYNLGGLKKDIKRHLKNFYSKGEKDNLIKLLKLLLRPIDTVKHQAKTITVGATRDTFSKKIIKEHKYQKPKFNRHSNNYFIYSNILHESYVYDIANMLTKFHDNERVIFNLARSYDLKKISDKNLNFLNLDLNLNKNNNNIISTKSYINLLLKISKLFKKNISLEKTNYNKMKKAFDFLDLKIKKYDNVKLLGSGVNYNISKILALKLTKKYKKPISFEILENHKHIDVSAEPLLINILGNIDNKIYHQDTQSEIIKFQSHNNFCISFVDSNNKDFYSKISKEMDFFYHPKVNEELSFTFYLNLFNKHLNLE